MRMNEAPAHRRVPAAIRLIPAVSLGITRVLVFVLALAAVIPAAAQDTSYVVQSPAGKHSPGGALWRAAVAPGWGQVYNGQYYKLPFVYAGLGGLLAAALYNNDRYLTYRRALLYSRDTTTYADYADEAAEFMDLIEAGQGELLEGPRDGFRRNRDLSYIGLGLFYALSVLDAYVSAHLLDFDIDEDLSMRLVPSTRGAPGIHAVWRLR